jgi:hypothetical protein
MPGLALLAGVKSVVSGVFEFAKTWIGGVLIAFVVAWLWSGWRHDAACRAKLAAYVEDVKRATAQEDARRARALDAAKAEAEADSKTLDAENRALKTKLKELNNASHAHDGRPGLPADGVRRLNQF